MEIKFAKIINSVEEIKNYDRTNAFNVAALTIHALANYQDDANKCFDMLQVLYGDFQPISPLTKTGINDSMSDKASYIASSYFEGATPNNNYVPNEPLTINVLENDYSYVEENIVKLYLKSSGADTERPITLRKAKDNNYYIFGEVRPLLSGIRVPENTNPWA